MHVNFASHERTIERYAAMTCISPESGGRSDCLPGSIAFESAEEEEQQQQLHPAAAAAAASL
jgi:hypothetical protein